MLRKGKEKRALLLAITLLNIAYVCIAEWSVTPSTVPATSLIVKASFSNMASVLAEMGRPGLEQWFGDKWIVKVTIGNPTDSHVGILWSQSFFILPSRKSVPMIDLAEEVLPSGIPPRSYVTATFTLTAQLSPGDTLGVYLVWSDSSRTNNAEWKWTFHRTQTAAQHTPPRPPPTTRSYTPAIPGWVWTTLLVLLVVGIIVELTMGLVG